jgi:cytochrome c biogenesis protein CcmG/thiol:disulfide interchange protein DsbE
MERSLLIHNVINDNKARHSRESGNPERHWIPGQARNDKLNKTYVVTYRWFVILSLCFGWAFLLPHCAKKEKESALAPDFTLKTLDDQEITLSKLRGKVVLLDFWATWCGPCKESIPHLVQIYKTYQQKGLEIIGMNVDRSDVSGVRRFVKSMDIPYPVVITPDEVERNYGVTGLPTTILLDKQGRVRDKIPGFSIKIGQEMAAKVLELISESP